MVELHVLRVFVGDDGRNGNPLGIVLDGKDIPDRDRQRVAAELGFSETVFVDDAERGEIRIFTPAEELPFAGHPSVGAAWLLKANLLRLPAGEVQAWPEGDLTWIAGRPEWAPEFEHIQLDSPEEIDGLSGMDGDLPAAWAWEDETAGHVRSRVFPTGLGIDEDEATGGAAVRLGALLGRELRIRQGRGSVIHVRPRQDGAVEIGGRVILDEVGSV